MSSSISDREKRQARAKEQRKKAQARLAQERMHAKRRAMLANVMEWALMGSGTNRKIARKLLSDALNLPADRRMFGLD
ncbi:ribosomal protein L9 [Thalassospira tepidiphila]|nr:ribosomal protein L9 [Thalassospira tepidiphila]